MATGTSYLMLLKADHRAMEEGTAGIADPARTLSADVRPNDVHAAQGSIRPAPVPAAPAAPAAPAKQADAAPQPPPAPVATAQQPAPASPPWPRASPRNCNRRRSRKCHPSQRHSLARHSPSPSSRSMPRTRQRPNQPRRNARRADAMAWNVTPRRIPARRPRQPPSCASRPGSIRRCRCRAFRFARAPISTVRPRDRTQSPPR